jgi:hypothetical protein
MELDLGEVVMDVDAIDTVNLMEIILAKLHVNNHITPDSAFNQLHRSLLSQ